MAEHSVLAPSSSNRWFNCTPSARLCGQFPDEGSVYASEGTEAHALCEFLLRVALGRDAGEDPRFGMKYYTREMQECCEEYVQFILERVAGYAAAGKKPAVFIEQRVDLREWVPESMGTADCLIVAGDEILVVDFKYGMLRVPASSLQLRLYALGGCAMFSLLDKIRSVRMVVFQPRLSAVDEMEMPADELLSWASSELAPRARLAFDGAGEFSCGEWCRLCRAKRSCRALAEYELEIARYGLRDAALLSDPEIADVLSRVDELVAWANGVREYALEQALQGHEYPGFKVVEGKAFRRFTDDAAVAARVEAEGKDPWEPRKVLGISAMEKLLGKKKFSELLSDLVVRPAGKPALVPVSDTRDRLVRADTVYAEMNEKMKG